MKVAVVQYSTEGCNDILGKAIGFIEESLKEKPDFILLPELFNTIYFPQYRDESYFDLATTIPGWVTDRILECIEGKNTTVIAPLFEKNSSNYHCSAAILDSEAGYVGTYRKLHIPSVENIHETYYFKPGDLGHRIFELKGIRFGCMLCYDRHFPESARIYGLGEVDVLFISAATPVGARDVWLTEMLAHAYSNGYYVVCSNRCGVEDRINFLGTSFIGSYNGKVLAKMGESDEGIIYRELDIDEMRTHRSKLAFYRDRRPDLYCELILKK